MHSELDILADNLNYLRNMPKSGMLRSQAKETHTILVAPLVPATHHHNSISPSGVAEMENEISC